jgi:D-glycero-alpha-D-manno-heptose-7-phosphate kinase
MLLFFTGYSRDADRMLIDQKRRSEAGDSEMLNGLHAIADLGRRVRQALEADDTHAFAALMLEHWESKKRRTDGMSSENIDRWYELAMANGALGGKLVGAGGGGFLLFYASEPTALREAMASAGLPEVRFQFDFDGSTVVARG